MDLNTVQVTLSRDGNKIGEGTASSVMGDQWTAALWTVNQAITQDCTIEPGHVIIGGTITRIAPAQPGKYVADYGGFGKIECEVR
jgi:2-keto-4-pentenoate hydratase